MGHCRARGIGSRPSSNRGVFRYEKTNHERKWYPSDWVSDMVFFQGALLDHISSKSSSSSSNPNSFQSPTSTRSGLTKTPYCGSQSKYLVPPTLPSFFPAGSSNFTPTQGPGPGSSGIKPTYATVPRRVVEGVSMHRAPTLISVDGKVSNQI